ncbi:MAG: hypothetical protein FWB78_11995 [Treponema sp.]|nr:hypothetical protein [Treponema sp.]
MKNRLGIIALAAAIALLTTGCPSVTGDNGNGNNGNVGNGPGGNNGTGNDGFIGPTLNLGGQVYTMDWYWDIETEDEIRLYVEFDGNLYISSELGGSGSIVNGQVSFTIDTPNELVPIGSMFEAIAEFYRFSFIDVYYDFKISDASVSSAHLNLFTPGGALSRDNRLAQYTDTGYSGVWEMVVYIYVDQEVTITGRGRTFESPPTFFYATKDLNITLRAGWNALHWKEDYVWNWITDTFYATYTLTIGDPAHIRWVLLVDN